MFNEAPETKIEPIVTIPLSEYRELISAGNSIVVDVLYYIFKELYEAMPYLFDDLKVGSYFSGIGAFESGLDRLYADINESFNQSTNQDTPNDLCQGD